MKKILLIPALVTMALSGCIKSPLDAEPDPVTNPNPPEEAKISFLASVEGPYTKVDVTTSDFYSVWEKNDAVLILQDYKQSYYKAMMGGDIWTTLKYSSGDVLDRENDIVAVYPADILEKGLPSVVSYEEVSTKNIRFMPMFAQAAAGEEMIYFKNVCGLGEFTYTNKSENPITLASIKITDKLPLSGKVSVVKGDIPSIALEGSEGLTVEFGENGLVLNPGEPIHIYWPMLSGIYKKLAIDITTVEGAISSIKYSGKVSMVRSAISPIDLTFVPSPDDPVDGVDLSKEGCANCYIVEAAGSYCFKANKGISDEPLENIASVEVLWETDNTYTPIEPEDLINYYDYMRGFVVFDVAGGIYGNAVIAAKDAEGNILWSWHIWVPEEVVGNIQISGKEVMDRSLGALKKGYKSGQAPEKMKFSSLLYQWGRKDPFVGTVVEASGRNFFLASAVFSSKTAAPQEAGPATVEQSIANPTIFYTTDYNAVKHWSSEADLASWSGDTKTMYDPCPPGYRVPDADVFVPLYTCDGTNNDNQADFSAQGWGFWPISRGRMSTGAINDNNQTLFWTNSSTVAAYMCYQKRWPTHGEPKSKFGVGEVNPTAPWIKGGATSGLEGKSPVTLGYGGSVRCQAIN